MRGEMLNKEKTTEALCYVPLEGHVALKPFTKTGYRACL